MPAHDEEGLTLLREDLRRYLSRRMRDDATVEDLVQDVFVRIQRSSDGLRSEESFGAWATRIAHNVLVDHLRRHRPEVPLPDSDGLEADEAGTANVVPAWLLPMIERLEPQDREVLRLVELQGVPQVEVARRLGLSVSGAKSRVQRARRRLRERILACCEVELDSRGNVLGWTRRRPPSDGDCSCRG